MTKHNSEHYQAKLKAIQARNLNMKQRATACLQSVFFWVLLYVMVKWVYHLWVPYVIEIQKFSQLAHGYLTYFFAALFVVVWLYLLYRTFQLALKYFLRLLSGVKEKS